VKRVATIITTGGMKDHKGFPPEAVERTDPAGQAQQAIADAQDALKTAAGAVKANGNEGE